MRRTIGKLCHSPFLTLPIDIEEAIKIYPDLELRASKMEHHLINYEDFDRLFLQHFLALFKNTNYPRPSDDKVWSTLIRLHKLAKPGDLIIEPLLRLEHNNIRASLACDMLTMLFKL